uniref:Uncharacterized protein n=1 Tax=Parascaris equorum TaxID=6256 RepID=A0A914RWQ5_PAREQ
MLIGDSCCGKTCLLIRFKDGAFLNNNFISTVGIDYRNKLLEVDNAKVKLQIWDTAGQERFRSVTSAYYRDADALLLVYDISNRGSFANIRVILHFRTSRQKSTEISTSISTNLFLYERNRLLLSIEVVAFRILITLVGNKMDLYHDRKVKYEEGKKLAEAYNIAFIETSAKTGQNVQETFQEIARSTLALKIYELHKPQDPYILTEEPHC